jgi:hypothetical protein
VEPYCTDVRATSIVLGIDEDADARALFACPIKPEAADEIQSKFEGKFADMRLSIMTLPTNEAQLVGRVGFHSFTSTLFIRLRLFSERDNSVFLNDCRGTQCSSGTKMLNFVPVVAVPLKKAFLGV